MYVIAVGNSNKYFKSTGWVTFTSTDIIDATKFHTKEDAHYAIKVNGLHSCTPNVSIIEVDKKTRSVIVHY